MCDVKGAAKTALDMGTFGTSKQFGVDDLLFPKTPGLPKIPKPPVLDPGAAAKKQVDAAAVAAIKAAGAYGSSDTLLTGPAGIGTVPSANLKTYLGQ